MKKFLLFATLLMLPLVASAYTENFFEYAPDYFDSKRLAVATAQTPYQIFEQPSAFILTGFDFWVDNNGSPGSVTFTLLGPSGNTLATKVASLTSLNPTPGGFKLHIDLDTQVSLAANTKYSIKISTSLVGFGLYYADRIGYLEHNREYTSEYNLGVAKLGPDEQDFSFKYALYRYTSTAQTSEQQTANNEQPQPTILITNARVASVTDHSATLVWTTNVAADSRANARLQFDPLYVISSAYDPTLELEHTLVIDGLAAKANYFSDVYSAINNQLVLTTYTIGFQTAAKATSTSPAPTATTSTQPASPAPTTATNTTPTPTQPANNQTATNPTSAAPAPGSEISYGDGERNGNINLSWPSLPDGEPSTGYRIDIFDPEHNLERQITVPPGTHQKEVAKLRTGAHTVIVYANDDGVYRKVSAPKEILIKLSTIYLKLGIGGSILVIIAGLMGLAIWKFKKEKDVLPPDTGYATG